MQKKTCLIPIVPINTLVHSVSTSAVTPVALRFCGERHVDGITVEQREVSVLFIAQRGEPQRVGTAICRDLPGIKRYLYTSEKTKRPGPLF